MCVCACSPIKNLCLSLGSVQGSVCDRGNLKNTKRKQGGEGREGRDGRSSGD